MANNQRRIGHRLSLRIFIYVLSFVVLSSVTLFLILRIWVIPTVESEVKNEVLRYSKMAASLIDGDTLQRIIPENLSSSSAEYRQILNMERKIMAADSRIDDVYTMISTTDPNMVRFVVDGYETKDRNGDGIMSPEETTAAIGEEYDITNVPVLKRAFLFPSLSEDYYTDKWGTFMTSGAPIMDSRGKVVGIVGVDVRMGEVIAQERILLIRFGFYAGLFLILALIFGTILSRLIIKSIGGLNRSVVEISEEESIGLLDTSGKDELADLSQSINKLVIGLRKARDEADEKVVEKTKILEDKVEELEKLNKLMVGREVVMFELKKELNKLKNDQK